MICEISSHANDEFFYLGAGGDHVHKAPCTLWPSGEANEVDDEQSIVFVMMSMKVVVVIDVGVVKTVQFKVRGSKVVKTVQAKVRGSKVVKTVQANVRGGNDDVNGGGGGGGEDSASQGER